MVRLLAVTILVGWMLQGGHCVNADKLRIAGTDVLSTKGSTRGTAYGSANKIVTIGSKTHVAWLDTKSATMIQTYDAATEEWLPPVHVGSGLDNHGGPALCADSKGYLHIVFGPHHGPLQYSRSERPNDASSWVKMPEFGDHATYPSLVCAADDTLYCAYRGKTAPFKLLFQRKPAGGEWSEPTVIVDAAVPDGYTQFGNCLSLAGDGTIHLAFHVYDTHPAAGKAAGHLQSPDGGETWVLADGAPVELPFTPDKPGWICKAPDLDLRVWTVDCDSDGNPYVCIAHSKPGRPEAEVWTYREGAWKRIGTAGALDGYQKGLRSSGATLCFDAQDNLYVLVSATDERGWSHPHNEIILLFSPDRGETFEVLPISQPNADVPNWLPSVERRTGHNVVALPHVLYTHGNKGEGCTPDDVTEIHCVRLQLAA